MLIVLSKEKLVSIKCAEGFHFIGGYFEKACRIVNLPNCSDWIQLFLVAADAKTSAVQLTYNVNARADAKASAIQNN